MIFRTPTPTDTELIVVAQIEDLKQRLRYLVSETPRRWQGLLSRAMFARAIRGSNSIEGYNVSESDAIAAAAREQPLDADKATWAAIEGYRDAMTYVLQLATDPHFRYSTDLLRALHFMMVKHDLSKNPGKWRPGVIYVRDDETGKVVYEGPTAEIIPLLMDELVQSLNDSEARNQAPMVRAAMGHLNLVMIHPFSDGNGRMGRCLQTLILARTWTMAAEFSSIEEYLGRNPRAYYDVLSDVGFGAWHPEREARKWVRFCLKAHFAQMTAMLRRSREMDKLWELLEHETETRGLPSRLVSALADAALGFQVRNTTYRDIEDLSENLASRDLRLAVNNGLLIPNGESRGRFYVAAPSILALREQVREPREEIDPFLAVLDPRQGSLFRQNAGPAG
ncbi:MAG: Fic family protein [Gemmatimonadaceae bacterium]